MKAPPRLLGIGITLMILRAPIASASDPCPRTTRNEEWDEKCFTETNPRRVRPEYLHKVVTNKRGFTTVKISYTGELLAIDRRGVVIVPNIANMGDFDYPDAESGMARYYEVLGDRRTAPWKCGYFDQKTMRIVVPAIYEACKPFRDGEAVVCNGCKSRCTEADCQNHVFIGGEILVLDRRNRILSRHPSPTLETLCSPPATLEVKTWGQLEYLTCKDPSRTSPLLKVK